MSQQPTQQTRNSKALEDALRTGPSRPERLPGLTAIMKQLPSEIAIECKSILYNQPRFRLINISALPFEQAGIVPPSGLAAVMWSERWKERVYCISDSTFALLYLEASLGGERPDASKGLGRKFERTEINIVEIFFKRFARALANSFSRSVDVKFEVVATGEGIDEELRCKPTAPVVAVQLAAEWFGQSARLSLLIPQSALEPIRALLSGPVGRDADMKPIDPDWSRSLSEEIARAFIKVNAVLEERPISLGDVQKFLAGQTLKLHCSAASPVRLDIEDRPAFWCNLGRSGNELSLRLERDVDPDEISREEV